MGGVGSGGCAACRATGSAGTAPTVGWGGLSVGFAVLDSQVVQGHQAAAVGAAGERGGRPVLVSALRSGSGPDRPGLRLVSARAGAEPRRYRGRFRQGFLGERLGAERDRCRRGLSAAGLESAGALAAAVPTAAVRTASNGAGIRHLRRG